MFVVSRLLKYAVFRSVSVRRAIVIRLFGLVMTRVFCLLGLRLRLRFRRIVRLMSLRMLVSMVFVLVEKLVGRV